MLRIVVFAILFFSIASSAANPEPYLQSAPMPFYPPLCRQARIQGDVVVKYSINEDGGTYDVEAVSGPKLLQEATVDEVRLWKFSWRPACKCHVKRQITFVYSFGDWVDNDGPDSIVKWFGKGPVERVEVQSGLMSVQTSGQ
jgi:TonB family protein